MRSEKMKTELERKVLGVVKTYGEDVKAALRTNVSLDYLYALSPMRENLLEWYPFRREGTLLQVGSDFGALTGLYSRRVSKVDVLDSSWVNLEINRLRHVEPGTCKNVNYVQGTLEEYLLQTQEQYDYVVIIGTLEEDGDQIRMAKKFLKPDGVLLVAAANPFGLKYWAGAQKDDCSFSKKTLIKMLSDTEDGEDLEFYYPMPDYKLPISVFSDAYLPKEGDLTDTITAYDFPRYTFLDLASSYDAVCRDGQFEQYANGYLVIWRKNGGRKLQVNGPQYMKYNRTREDEFQLKTTIFGNGTSRWVEKAALEPAGISHIQSFASSCEALTNQHEVLKYVRPQMEAVPGRCRFPYLQGRSLSGRLDEEIHAGQDPVELIRQTIDILLAVEEAALVPFAETPEFAGVFGQQSMEALLKEAEQDGEPIVCFRVSNIDLLFDNILLTDDGMYCLDYEWVFSFPIPAEFIRYRILFYSYRQFKSLLSDYGDVSQWLSVFGIGQQAQAVYADMERTFQYYVHGENQRIYLENYLVDSHLFRDYDQMEDEYSLMSRQLNQAMEREERLRLQIHDQNTAMRKMTEVKRLTDNHVANLEVMIRDLRHEIDEMAKTLAYLNRHEALIFKIRRKLGEKFNARYPKGTVERKRLHYRKEYMLHPIRSFRFYRTEEGRNLREGDFEIGDVYREHGRLEFPYAESPEVSVIIPVYNQIQYTYLCLASILAHTQDVSYEVIIADDVSDDATKNIDRYATGLVVCRNEVNQGFLKNCNHAAEKARGRYLMFLNNDTQVTDGWLSSLVNLIRSDDTIGMVGSKLVYPDGKLQEAGGIIWSDGSGWNYGRMDNPDKPEYNYVKDVDYISGAAILLPRELWNQIGGFDERYAPAYCEDSDLAFEVRKAGYRVVYQPLSKIIHYEGVSNGTDTQGEGLKRYQVENSEKLKEKWAVQLAEQCENTGNPDPFRARERSMGKKIILVVDHYVPTYDKDAGSKTTFQYLKMFIKKGYVVKFLGDNFAHEEPYSTALEQMGIEILSGADYEAGIWNWLRDHGKDIDVAYLNRPHIAIKYVDFLKENTNCKIIYYGHDLHFLREGREYMLSRDEERLKSAEYWKAVEMSLFYKADISYYPSCVERDAVRAEDETIAVKDIVAYVYDQFRDSIPADFEKREGLLFVGGFAHPPNADAVLWFAKEVYPLIRRNMEEKGLTPPEFYVVGSRVTDEIKELEQPGSGIIIKGFVSEEELTDLYDKTRMVVVPLRYGAGVKGKVVEALYHGAAVVTTTIGAEGIPQAEEVMAIADQPEAFAEAVTTLYSVPEDCRAMSQRTQEYIREHYSVEAAWNVIREDFETGR